MGILFGFLRSLPVTPELREIHQGGRKLVVGSLVPCKGRCEPSTFVLLDWVPEPQGLSEVLKLSLWKAEGKQNRSESRFRFWDCSLTGMALWFSAFRKILVPVCFIDINYCKSDSFSAYWFLPKVKVMTFNRKRKWLKKKVFLGLWKWSLGSVTLKKAVFIPLC